MPLDLPDENHLDRTRLRQWARGRARSAGVDRRDLMKLFAVGAAAGSLGVATGAGRLGAPVGAVDPADDGCDRAAGARASDGAGHTQPDTAAPHTQGYLFDAVVRHPVTVV